MPDININYGVNKRWLVGLCKSARRFLKVLLVPDNHALWVIRNNPNWRSLRECIHENSESARLPFR
jgi:hypothetical protein